MRNIVLTMPESLAKIVVGALIVESEGPRSDNLTEEEIAAIEGLVAEIDGQLKASQQ